MTLTAKENRRNPPPNSFKVYFYFTISPAHAPASNFTIPHLYNVDYILHNDHQAKFTTQEIAR